jgi:ankyrin repeat protein
MYCAAAGKSSIVRHLLTNGADHSLQDNVRSTALTLAAEEGHTDIANCLIEHRADLRQQNRHGDTALHVASACGHDAIVRLLLANGAVHCANRDGRFPLHLAAFFGNSQVIASLAADTNINQRSQDHFNVTALELATFKNNLPVVQSLLANGGHCYFSIRGALRAATIKGNQPIFDLIKAHGESLEIQRQAVIVMPPQADLQKPLFLSCTGLQQILHHQGNNPKIPHTNERLAGYQDLANGINSAAQGLSLEAKSALLETFVERLNSECPVTLQPLVVPRTTVSQLVNTLKVDSNITLPAHKTSFTGQELCDLLEPAKKI